MQNASSISAFLCATLHVAATAVMISIPFAASAQDPVQGTEALAIPVVPQQVRFAGKLATRGGDTVEAMFSIYAAAAGGEPLWSETQRVTISEDGSYTVLLGSANSNGLPQAVFAGGAARWLGVRIERSPEQERVLLSSVPYAMKSADAESLAGHAASDFVTQNQFAQFTQSAQATLQAGSTAATITPLTSGTLTGSGTAGTVPLWTGALTQGNSVITQVGSDVGINEVAPGATLDVGGTANFRGTATLPAESTATTSAGYRSQLLDFTDSAWSTTTKAPVAQTWRLYATDSGNNSANPTSSLNFQFQNGAGAATPTILSIAQTGVITFAPTQTFPGTIKSVAATSPLVATTNSGAVSLAFSMPALETALNGLYAQLGQSNTFTSNLSASTDKGIEYAAVAGNGSNGSIGVFGNSDTGYGVYAETTTGQAVFGQATAPTFGSVGVLGSVGTNFSNRYTTLSNFGNAGVWADQSCCVGSGLISAGLIATADSGSASIMQNKSSTNAALSVENFTGPGATVNGTSGDGLDAVSNGNGNGISGTSNNSGGSGVKGLALTPIDEQAGVLGIGGSSSNTFSGFGTYAGVWGDTGEGGGVAVSIAGTADDGRAGLFINNSADYTTLYVLNIASGGSTGLFKTFMAKSADGTCGIGGKGDLSCTGQVKALVSTGGARTVETYAPQSAENWMEDYGTGVMERGVSVVKIDPAFAETISQSADYHVFITPRADSKGLYVINATLESFEVRESGGGTSSLSFDYKIVAKRRGYEAQRLTDVTERFKAEVARATPTRVGGQTPVKQDNQKVQPKTLTTAKVRVTPQMPTASQP